MSTGTSWKSYQDFVLKIEPAGERRYRAEAHAPTGEAQVSFDLPFDQRDIELFLLKVGHPRKIPTRRLPEQAQDAVAFGARLYDAVICDEVRDLFARARYEAARSGQGLRLQLRLAGAPELADWPWEFLNDGRDFLALSADTPIVRYLDLPEPPRPIQVQPPLRILVTVSAPQGLPELDAEQERVKLLESLAALSERGAVTVEFTPDATLRTLQGALRRARSEGRPYHVWHYIGHGAFMRSRSASVLAFCTPRGLLHRVGDLELGTLFDGYPEMRLVLLNACEGARPDPQDPFAGVAAALVRRGVPAVIGMQMEISDEAARTLSQVFYEALVDGLPVDAALTEARRAVFFSPNWTEWATPVLYMRAPDGRIFDVSALPPRPDATQPVRTSTRAQESERRARSAQLAALYTDARAAYYTSQWESAIELLNEIVSIQADYERAADMLQEAKRRHTLTRRYTRGSEAYEARKWNEAIEHLEAVIALEPGHQAAAGKLEDARHQKRLADLYADACQLYQAKEWQAVLAVFEDLQAIEPGYPDPERLLSSAREALEAEKLARQLADLYELGLRHMDDAKWSEALECLEQIAQLEPGYRDAQGLLDRVRAERAAQERALTLAQRYTQGSAAYDAQDWAEAIQHLKEVIALDAGYRDAADRLQDAERQQELDGLYARARLLHKARRWQEAVQVLERIQTMEPTYPDREGLLDSARAALEAGERAHKLAALHDRGVRLVTAQKWPEALECLEQVSEQEQGYRDTDELLARVRRELQPARPAVQPSTKHGLRSWPVWAWAVLGAVALLLLGGGILLLRSRKPAVGDTRVRKRDDAVMVYVPAGEFWMGIEPSNGETPGDALPRHRVVLDAFWIDRTEVTNAQYQQCVEAGACSPPHDEASTSRESYYGNPWFNRFPVVNVTWYQAREYAEWVGGRLPTEAEWEYACRGPGGSIYPWGNDSPDDALLNYGANVGDTTAVGSYTEGKSWCGALDMGGNVGEWTQSIYKGYPYDPADGREDLSADGPRVLRGGSFYSSAAAVRCGRRYWSSPRDWNNARSFRVCVVAQ